MPARPWAAWPWRRRPIPWVRAAILSSASRQSVPILRGPGLLRGRSGPAGPDDRPDPRHADRLEGREGPGRRGRGRSPGRDRGGSFAPWRLAALAGAARRRSPGSGASAPAVTEAFEAARRLAGDPAASVPDREAAIGLVGRDDGSRGADSRCLVGLLDPQDPPEVQAAAVRALGAARRPRIDRRVCSRAGPAWGPALRAALDALLSRPGSAGALLGALEAGTIPPPRSTPRTGSGCLRIAMRSCDPGAAHLLSSAKAGARQAVLEACACRRLSRPGDPARGKAVFAPALRRLPQVRRQGARGRPRPRRPDGQVAREALLAAILDPNREVDARYASYTAALKDGRVVTGLIASETASAITLKRQEGQADVILRADLEELKTSGNRSCPRAWRTTSSRPTSPT